MQQTIRELVQHKVAVTSTLAVFESTPALQPRFMDALSPSAALSYLAGRERLSDAARATSAMRIKKELEFERAFVKAGGLLMAGCDPTGNGSALAGGPVNQASPIKIQFPTSATGVISVLWTGLGGSSGDSANWTVGSTTACTSSVAGETNPAATATATARCHNLGMRCSRSPNWDEYVK